MNEFINTNYTFANLKQRKEGVCYAKKRIGGLYAY